MSAIVIGIAWSLAMLAGGIEGVPAFMLGLMAGILFHHLERHDAQKN